MATSRVASEMTAVDFQHSPNLASILDRLQISLVVSTYQAGKVITIGTHHDNLQIRFSHFEQAMGIARTPTGLAVGSRRQIWYLTGAPELGPKIAPVGQYDAAFVTRRCHYTGPIMGHEMAWGGDQLWVVNTMFSCLCTIDPDHHFAPRWMPPFITNLAAEDRCHLNGLAMENDRPRYVSVLGETDVKGGWRANKASGGALIDVRTNEVIVRGLCMPHSPRVVRDDIVFLNSGLGQICRVDRQSKSASPIVQLTGYARGLDIYGRFAFVGLSRIRDTAIFGGIPIAERRDELHCGVAVVDLSASTVVAFLHFLSGVEEVFEVKVLPGYKSPILSGPLPDVDQADPLWLVAPMPKVGEPLS